MHARALGRSDRRYVRQYISVSPSKKSVQRLKAKVRALLVPSNTDPWPEVREDLNRSRWPSKDYAEANIAPGARIVSDGLGCFGGLAEDGLKHKAIITGSEHPTDELLKCTNTGLGNKSATIGTRRSFDPQQSRPVMSGASIVVSISTKTSNASRASPHKRRLHPTDRSRRCDLERRYRGNQDNL
jgi:hypothetical protein